MSKVGRGRIYIFSAPSLISNRYSSYREKDTRYHAENFPFNDKFIDRLADELTGKIKKMEIKQIVKVPGGYKVNLQGEGNLLLPRASKCILIDGQAAPLVEKGNFLIVSLKGIGKHSIEVKM